MIPRGGVGCAGPISDRIPVSERREQQMRRHSNATALVRYSSTRGNLVILTVAGANFLICMHRYAEMFDERLADG